MRTRSTLTQLFAILFILCSTAGIIPIRVLAQTKKPTAQKPGGANPPKFKGYFEPVNYPEDVELSDVWFVDADTGWACGALKASAAEEGGFIINTRDGGKTWKLQMGDPHSATRGWRNFSFSMQRTVGRRKMGANCCARPTARIGRLSVTVLLAGDLHLSRRRWDSISKGSV